MVGGVRVEAEEAPLAHHVSFLVELLDTDVVEVGGSVHGRARVGLREVQQVGLERAGAHGRRKLVEPARALLAARLAQHAEPRAGHRHQPRLAVLVARELVVALPEEGEVVVLEPGDERPRLGDVAAVDRRRVRAQRGHHVERPGTHLGPVLHRGPHLADHAEQVSLQLGELPRVGMPGHLGVDHRLGHRVLRLGAVREHLDQATVLVTPYLDDRVDDQIHPEAAPVQLHGDRIDQERHVVGHDLDRGVRGAPAVRLEARVVDPHLRGAGRAPPGEVEVGERGAVDVERRCGPRCLPARPSGSTGVRTPPPVPPRHR